MALKRYRIGFAGIGLVIQRRLTACRYRATQAAAIAAGDPDDAKLKLRIAEADVHAAEALPTGPHRMGRLYR
jgi:hypothetical protein